MNIYIEGDIELLEALGRRLEKNGFICDGADDRQTDSMQVTGEWFQYKTMNEGCNFIYSLPQDWDYLKGLEPVPEVKAGQYWQMGGEIKRIYNIDDSARLPVMYKVINDKNHYGGSCKKVFLTNKAPHKLLSENEIQEALIAEAKARGFNKDARWSFGNGVLEYEKNGDTWEYYSGMDKLFLGNFHAYSNGEWAEIVEDEWEVDGNPFIHVTNGRRSISTISPFEMKREQAYAIAEALNDLDKNAYTSE